MGVTHRYSGNRMPRSRILILSLLVLLLHAWVAWRLIPALALPHSASMGLWGYMLASALLMPSPILMRLARLPDAVSAVLAWTGYLCMGLFSGLFVLSFLRDVSLIVLFAVSLLVSDTGLYATWAHDSAWGVVLLSLGISVLGFINARRTARVKRVEVPIADLPDALHGFTIVQLSDVHVGPTIHRDYLGAIVRRVNRLEADLIALTGDIVDGHVDGLKQHVAPLAELRSRHGSYYVPGNHEYYHDIDAWLPVLSRLNLNILMNRGAVLRHNDVPLLVGGVTDFNGHHFGPQHRSDPVAAARCEETVALKLLLAHQPRSAEAAEKAGFDLQLSGHTHGGQFLPWNLFVPMQQPFVAGLDRLNKLWVYTSRGTGYWGPPLRFGAPSEITHIRLVAPD